MVSRSIDFSRVESILASLYSGKDQYRLEFS